MTNAWAGKPCALCGGKKGPSYLTRKYCGKCVSKAKKVKTAKAHETRVMVTYGLETGDYLRLYEGQGGVCALCQRATGRTRRLTVDHDHKTGLVRGLLCRSCNDMLGHGRDDPIFFGRAVAYLAAPPAVAILGYRTAPENVSAANTAGRRYRRREVA